MDDSGLSESAAKQVEQEQQKQAENFCHLCGSPDCQGECLDDDVSEGEGVLGEMEVYDSDFTEEVVDDGGEETF